MHTMKNKKGDMLSGASFEVIVGVAVVVLIAILIAKLFAPVYYERDKISESYFEQLKDNVALADDFKSASFYILDNGDDDLDFYLVYFGGALQLSYGDGVLYDAFGLGKVDFSRSGPGENIICICSRQGDKGSCKYCVSLDLPAISNVEGVGDSWVVSEGNNINVVKSGGNYGFSVK